MPTLLDEPEIRSHANVAQAERLWTTVATMRPSFTWFVMQNTRARQNNPISSQIRPWS